METNDDHRPEQIQNIIRAISILGDALEEANNENIQREKAKKALLAVISFLNSIPKFDHDCLAFPLAELLADLHDLDEGITGRTLKKNKKAKGPKKGSWKEFSEIRIISIVDLLIEDYGISIDESCEFLARIIGNSEFVIRGRANKPTKNTIKNLRYEIKNNKKGEDEIKESANLLRAELQIGPETPPNSAKRLIKNDLISAMHVLKKIRKTAHGFPITVFG